ncbi:MAG TPA: S9 family peptidase [Rubrivivax sp.]|nr:S9 family peptidase [Rubrivivax sp.]
MAKKKNLTIDMLWQLQRAGAPSLAPDGAQAVCALSSFSMQDNKSSSALWLLSTLGGRPRALTHCGDKDGQPQWSPKGDLIAFVAQREQQGRKDDEPQLYLIAPDGGEARRAGFVATGVEAFAWFPDGRRIAFVSWVWPGLKGLAAQQRAHKAFKERKESGYVTSQAQYRHWDSHLPMGRVPHLLVMDIASGRVRDLFEGLPYELVRSDPDRNAFDIAPDGRRIAFAFDAAAEKLAGNCFALAEIDVRTRRVRELARDAAWDMGAPRYSPDGARLAFLASHQGRKHTMPAQLCVWERDSGGWEVVSAEWDHELIAPLLWEEDGQSLLFAAEQHGRQHLWRFDLPDRRAEVVVHGGTVSAFDKRAGTLVTLGDSAAHPARLHAHLPGEPARRLEDFNDRVLAGVALGRSEERWFRGALGDELQMWLSWPPGFDAKKRWPLLHVIHGGPHSAAGDSWHYRWNSALFAAMGYVVCSVNYHGSSGFGYAFLDSISQRYGQLELQDIEAATDLLLREPWADAQRVFAAGGSYGGYLVAWMNGHAAPGRYQAYVCHAGCFDWTAMFADDSYPWHAREFGAWYWDNPAQVNAQSALSFAAQMRTPTLVVHGALDYRVPDQQGLAYYNTLKARKVDARLLWFPDENHWVQKPRNSRLWYAEFFDWLKAHDPGARPRRARADSRSRA